MPKERRLLWEHTEGSFHLGFPERQVLSLRKEIKVSLGRFIEETKNCLVFFFNICCLRTHFWLCWVSATVRALPPAAASGAYFPLWRRLRWILSRWILPRWSAALERTGSAAPPHVQSSETRDWTLGPSIGKWILIHWTNRAVQNQHSKRALVPKHRGNKRWGSGVGCSTANNRRSILGDRLQEPDRRPTGMVLQCVCCVAVAVVCYSAPCFHFPCSGNSVWSSLRNVFSQHSAMAPVSLRSAQRPREWSREFAPPAPAANSPGKEAPGRSGRAGRGGITGLVPWGQS